MIVRILFLAALPLCLTGCGRSDLSELGTVSGVVTIEDGPVANAIVNFTRVGSGRPSTGETDSQGRYSLAYLTDVDGAIIGEHVVTVELVVTDEKDDLPDDLPDDPRDLTSAQQLAIALPHPASDGSIRREVKPDGNTIDITL